MTLDRILELVAKVMLYEVSLGGSRVSISAILFVSLLFLGFIVLSRVVRRFLTVTLFPKLKADKAAEFTILKVTHYAVMALGALICISTLGVNISSLAFIAGFLSVGIGFGLQNLVQNFAAGLILLFEKPIAIGDWVTVNGQEGEVKEINLRSTGIETGDGIYIIVPNQSLIVSEVINGSKGEPWVRGNTIVGVAYDTDLNAVKAILMRLAQEHPKVLKDPPPSVSLAAFGESSVDMKVDFAVIDPRHRGGVRADLRWAIWWAFKDAGIEIPYAQRELRLRSVGTEPLPVKIIQSPPRPMIPGSSEQ